MPRYPRAFQNPTPVHPPPFFCPVKLCKGRTRRFKSKKGRTKHIHAHHPDFDTVAEDRAQALSANASPSPSNSEDGFENYNEPLRDYSPQPDIYADADEPPPGSDNVRARSSTPQNLTNSDSCLPDDDFHPDIDGTSFPSVLLYLLMLYV